MKIKDDQGITYSFDQKDKFNYITKRLGVLKERLVKDINDKDAHMELSILKDALANLESEQ